jgi:tetratricopeptide (TPR) repeat protein
MAMRWDETWHRLLQWTSNQGPSERLAAQVLLHEGFRHLDPSHPLGGRDGKKDAVMWRGDDMWIMAVYFPRGQQSFRDIKNKFAADLAGVASNGASGIAFVTNQELSLAEREDLRSSAKSPCDIYHLERLVAILDQPSMAKIRAQFLNIDAGGDTRGPTAPRAVFVHKILPTSGIGKHFVARSEDLRRLETFLVPPEPAHVCPHIAVIAGMPGVGKTALALEAASRACNAGAFAGGAVLVDLRGYEEDPRESVTAPQLLSSLLLALGSDRVAPEPDANFVAYGQLLGDADRENRAILFVFDNVADIRQISELLPSSSLHRVLITTRNSLGPRIPDSERFLVKPLSDSQSIELVSFSSRRQFASQEEELLPLARLCGGLPIALHLVAQILANEPFTSARELARELEEEANRLAGLEFEDAAVRAVFRGSYIRLPVEAAKCLRYLALHPGRELTAPAAAHLLGDSEVHARRLIRHLASSHMIMPEHDRAMWQLHDLLRLFAKEASCEADSDDARRAALRRLFRYYFETSEGANGWINGKIVVEGEGNFSSTRDAISWVESEYENVIACMGAAADAGELVQAWELAISIYLFLSLKGDWSRAIAVSELALSAARSLADKDKEAAALNNLGLALNSLRRPTEGKAQFLLARKLYRELDNPEGEARVLVGLTESLRLEGSVAAAVPVLRRAVRLNTKSRNLHGLGFALTNLGTALRELGDYGQAIHFLEHALEVHRQSGARRAEAATLGQLGTALGEFGSITEGVSTLKQALCVAEEVADELLVGMALLNLGNASFDECRYDDAERTYRRALGLFEQLEDRWRQAATLWNMSRIYRRSGRDELTKECEDQIEALGFGQEFRRRAMDSSRESTILR